MSIIGGLLAGGLAYTFAKTDQAMKIDEKAQKKYAQAYERQASAIELIKEKQQLADDSLMKVANRKRAIFSTTIKDFLQLYENIIKINFTSSEGVIELSKSMLSPANIEEMRYMTVVAISPMSEKELTYTFLVEGLKGWFFAGPIGASASAFGGAMVKDSERNLSKANSQLKISDVLYSQAETTVVILDMITERSKRIADLLAKMNLLFLRSIKSSSEVIAKNGFDRLSYNVDDRMILMTCINLADAVKKIIDTPLLDKNGELTQASLDTLEIGNEYMKKLEQL